MLLYTTVGYFYPLQFFEKTINRLVAKRDKHG